MSVTINGTDGLVFADNSTQATAAKSGMVNRIINGAMMIDQRNAGASVTPTDGQYVTDRFMGRLTQASKYTLQQVSTAPTGFVKSLQATSSSAYSVGASDRFSIEQNIEGLNVADLGWGAAGAASVTISFWVRSSLTGTFGGSLINSAATRSYPFVYTINAANTWKQKSVTIAGDTSGTWLTDNGIGIRCVFNLGAGSSVSNTAGAWASGWYPAPTGSVSVVGTSGATFYITGVQLEKGSTATSFDYRPYGTELALCQRYYCKSFQQSVAPVQNSGSTANCITSHISSGPGWYSTGTFSFPITMRTVPTITTFNPLAANANWRKAIDNTDSTVTVARTSESFVALFTANNINATDYGLIHISASAEL